MFSRVLIANRGEIASRIIRTCKRMGIAVVAVYSEADQDAPYVQQADEAHYLGRALAKESYLNIPAIVRLAQRFGAEAIHPGYGFLSENPRFARACQEAGIVFIGPSPEVMERMGDKVLARILAREAGLPLIPGTDTPVEDEDALRIAEKIGYPLMVKAAEGGGGIGVRVVDSPDRLLAVMGRARHLARSAFGSPRLYLEKYITEASHVEVQVLADSHGATLHLLERDCSVQRRHQKVLEETPCIKIDETTRQRLTDAALRLVHHVGYTNAGTVEFLVDRHQQFYFLEMNTRLQVEHPITEMVTGLDLVELQLRVAAGEPLPLRQEDVRSNGHAIEARIYAEEPGTLTPVPGVIERVQEPQGQHIRLDGTLFPGYRVTTYYDPLLAKLTAWGKTREEAVQRLWEALTSFVIEGVPTNIPVITQVLHHPSFLSATYTGSFLERLLAQLSEQANDRVLAAAIGSAVAELHHQESEQHLNPWRLQGRQHLLSPRQRVRRWQ
ncbi:MAG: acetyl-CoA carboxylase biotin carboxylase subunit [Chloroflexi bacterium]|nr:acetyl-CoA carboxylase biotin carboxylase subunit [Chloroflexota bacterium]